MKNKELLVKFLKENFDLTAFNINWKTDWFVELTDETGDKITFMCFKPDEIWSSINDKPHLSYRLRNDNFVVVN